MESVTLSTTTIQTKAPLTHQRMIALHAKGATNVNTNAIFKVVMPSVIVMEAMFSTKMATHATKLLLLTPRKMIANLGYRKIHLETA